MATTYYVDPIAGLDTNNGTSISTPKQYWKTVDLLLGNGGDVVNLAAGCYHDVRDVSGDMPTTQKLNVTITSYDAGYGTAHPCFDGITYEPANATGWTHEGSGVWSKGFGTSSPVRRLFTGSSNVGQLLSQRIVGTAQRRTPDTGASATTDNVVTSIIPGLTAGDGSLWYGAGSALSYKLYVYTGSTTVSPPAFYNGLAFIQVGTNTKGITNAFGITKAQHIRVSNIDARGTAGEAFLVYATDTDTTPVDDVTFTNCNATYVYNSAGRVKQITTQIPSPVTIANVTFKNCRGDTSTSPQEQEIDSTKWSRLSGNCDMFYATGRILNVRFEDCTSVNSFHSSATLGALDANSSQPIASGFLRHISKADTWAAYVRGMAIYPCEASCFARKCTFDGMNVRSQFSGGVKVTAPVFKNQRAAIRKPGTDGLFAIESYIIDSGVAGIGNERYVNIQPLPGLTIAHGTFGPCYGNPIEFNAFDDNNAHGVASSAFALNSITIANNVFQDTLPARAGLPFLIATQQGTASVTDQLVFNNAVWKGTGAAAATVTYRGTSYAINAAVGWTGNITVDPQLDAVTLHPAIGSPVIGAGKFAGHYYGNDGKPFKLPSSMGAFEDFSVTARTLKV